MSFRILVGVKRVIDYAVRIRVKPDIGSIEYGNVKHSMNPFDEIAVEEALRIKTAISSTKPEMKVEVVVVSIGPKAAGETLRTALAMGADRAIHVDLESENSENIQSQLPPQAIAKIFEKLCKKEEPQLIFLGKQAIDDDSNATGQLLAEILGIPQATFASKVELLLADSKVHVTREIDGGLETIECSLPTVITTDLRLNEPRYATLPNIMKAKSKPFQVESLQSLGVSEIVKNIASRMKIVSVSEPEKRKGGIKVKDVDDLIEKLRNEAGVL